MYKIKNLANGKVYRFKTLSEALLKATVIHNLTGAKFKLL